MTEFSIFSGMPKGVITLWYGLIAAIPKGWHLCDGTADTPDLRNVFIVGANSDSGGTVITTLNNAHTGGAATHTHTLSGSTDSNFDNITSNPVQYTDSLNALDGVQAAAGTDVTAANATHSHAILDSVVTAGHTHDLTTASAASGSTLPPFKAYAYIMKT